MSSETIAVVGAGVIGCSVANALARERRQVVLFDRAEPGMGGASYGNVGHIAAELVQPLPSRELIFNFWRELFAFDGPLDLAPLRMRTFSTWAWRFCKAAFQREANTRSLAPLVKASSDDTAQVLHRLGRSDLLRRNGHYQVWFGPKAAAKAAHEAAEMGRLGIPTASMPRDTLNSIARAAGERHISGLAFPDSAHVMDPLEVVRALLQGALHSGSRFERVEVRALRPLGDRIELATESGPRTFDAAVICAGAWAEPLLRPFGLRAPLEAGYGYHVELADHPAHTDGPLVYMDQKILVTPMAGRLRSSTYMEFTGLGSPADPRKPARLRHKLQKLGYRCESEGPSWRGPRPILPDYLPGIGRACGGRRLFYAIGHQVLGLTLAAVTGELIADLVAGRTPRHDITAFDLCRFG